MCKFLSAVYTQDARLFCDPEHTDSHSELIAANGIHERELPGIAQKFVRLELIPDADWSMPDKWAENVDEHEVPAWFDADARAKAFGQMRAIAAAMFLVDVERKILLGGCWILKGNTVIHKAENSHIAAMCGGTLTTMRGGTLTAMCGGTLTEMCGGTLTTMRGGTLTAMCGGTLTEMRGGTLTEMRGGTLTTMWGGTLTEMWGGTITTDYRAAKESVAETKAVKRAKQVTKKAANKGKP